MAETTEPGEPRTVRADSVEDVAHHMGAESCSYDDCTNPAAYDVTMRKDGQETTFAACHGCAVENGVRPGEWDD